MDKEPHRIRPPAEPRPVGSKEPVKSSRTPFSAADDALLAAWVSESKHKSGNKIYQELEAEVSLTSAQCFLGLNEAFWSND